MELLSILKCTAEILIIIIMPLPLSFTVYLIIVLMNFTVVIIKLYVFKALLCTEGIYTTMNLVSDLPYTRE